MKVMAGTQNGLRPVTVEAVRVKEETLLAQVIHLVGQAQRSRVPLQRTVDRIARWFRAGRSRVGVRDHGRVDRGRVVWRSTTGTRPRGSRRRPDREPGHAERVAAEKWQKFLDQNWINYAVICGSGC